MLLIDHDPYDRIPLMKNKILFSMAAVILVLFFGIELFAQSGSSPIVTQEWQHLAFEHEGTSIAGSPDLVRRINSLGDEGWQLVDVESIGTDGSKSKMIFFFKRLK